MEGSIQITCNFTGKRIFGQSAYKEDTHKNKAIPLARREGS
jgi:hypothetical protein